MESQTEVIKWRKWELWKILGSAFPISGTRCTKDMSIDLRLPRRISWEIRDNMKGAAVTTETPTFVSSVSIAEFDNVRSKA